MSARDTHESEAARPEATVASQRGFDLRIISFYFFLGAVFLVLAGGAAYRQLIQTGAYGQTERLQQERRVLFPGSRGRIYDRRGRLLAGNRPRFSVVLYLDELQGEFQAEAARVRANYHASGDRDVTWGDMVQIGRVSVVQRYLDRVNALLGRHETLDARALERHFREQLLIPYPLVNDLSPAEFARLIEGLPVRSPLQLYVSTTRVYPYGAAASHVLGYVSVQDNVAAADFPGADLMTFKMKGTAGSDGLEKTFDARLQGKTGDEIFRVDPAGFKVNPPLSRVAPQPGHDLVTSLDIDLQTTAEDAIGDYLGAAAMIDVRTGEVLALASKPDYNLNDFAPPRNPAAIADVTRRQAWTDYAIGGRFPPGSTFKILVSIAGLRSGRLDPNDEDVDCEGYVRIGNRIFSCDNGEGHHGRLNLSGAIAESCDIYFYEHGLAIGPTLITEEARRFHLDRRTGIELPGEIRGDIPDPKTELKRTGLPWTQGLTADIAIGQGAIAVTPLEMACFAASVARGEVWTQPTLLHDPNRPEQHTEPIGLTAAQRAVIIRGMEGVVTDPNGTAAPVFSLAAYSLPGIRIAGKTGTAQYGDKLDIAWFICFAPADHPEVALAVAVQGDTRGESFGGGLHAAPIASVILRKYFEETGAIPKESPAAAPAGG